MQFLLESVRQNRRRLRIEELLLLLLRVLAILLLAAGIARFTGCTAIEVLPGTQSTQTVAYLLDTSFSMEQTAAGESRFGEAQADLAAQIEQIGPTNEVILMTTPPVGDGGQLFRGPVTEPKELVNLVKDIEPSDRRANLGDALARAVKALKMADNDNRRLYIFSDFRRSDLSDPAASKKIAEQFRKLRDLGVEVIAMDYARPSHGNLTLEEVILRDRFAVARRPVRLSVTIRNNAPTRVDDVKVGLTIRHRVSGKQVETRPPQIEIASIQAGETHTATTSVTIAEAGPAVVTAQLPGDELKKDNTAHLALDVRKAVEVLVVDGHPDAMDPTESESFFFTLATDPEGAGSSGNRVSLTTPQSLARDADLRFSDYDLVALLNVPDFTRELDEDGKPVYPRLGELEEYVRDGGGLAIFTGDRVNLQFYKTRFYNKGSGLLPYFIHSRVGDPGDKNTFFRLDPQSLRKTRILSCFAKEGVKATNYIRFFAFHKAQDTGEIPAESDIKRPVVLARFNDEDESPAIVSRKFGEGMVVTFYTTASRRWNDWPEDLDFGSYVAVVQDLIETLARSQRAGMTAAVGEPIVQEVPRERSEATASLQAPAREEEMISLVPEADEEGGRGTLRFERAVHAGIYTMVFENPTGGSAELYFARNVDPTEGRLAPGGEDALSKALGSNEFAYVARREGAATGEAAEPFQSEYWAWALVALLAAMALETVLAQKFGHYS